MDDLISRQDAINEVEMAFECVSFDKAERFIVENLNALPSAQPYGEWKLVTYAGDPDCPRYVCSNCDYSMLFYEMDDNFNYCPNCGADMRPTERNSYV